MSKLPELKIGDLVAKIPIIQGGMGIGVSLSNLAAAVANEGGIGIISGVQNGFMEDDFESNTLAANIRGLKKQIKKARELSPSGIIGVNIMVAINNYKEIVKAAVEEKIDVIISGAGLPAELPDLVKETKTKIAPIVSTGKAAALICKMWDRKYDYLPDFIVVEGPEAGGHLGFSLEQLNHKKEETDLETLVKDVIESIKPYEEKYSKKIPVIAAGGVYTGEDIAKFIKIGAAGVQMATRFVATDECDAHIDYKMAYINATKEDIRLVKSPAGLPGRGLFNKFASILKEQNIPINRCLGCLKTCNPSNTPYCITDALIEAVKGNIDEGLIFVGSNAYKLDKIVTVKELMNELVSEAELAL
ncbi:NAD(P)H-dependent flavin oxidoreductase [Serpentinicella alkaliphila]|uniref:Probable nitronate monooxygenase n=1 Tax=Serpentinicella alkaliphila TaxID=1734049 RepID=A0A4R2TVH1_9FIRM|nr:nitronate monooxygenase [Serpentinicella alkaliphila]QUH26760.1 nitronate monooxygenase [Serpentinicella alkaliphila]TCQ07980.1 NAD(P)H-dependent flavin oxidoreductase YrpB (nitropropane dioxygenase family) [Serpentinicella alkaliphila]